MFLKLCLDVDNYGEFGGGGSRLRTRLYGGFPANREKYREHCHVKDLVRGEIR